MSLHFAGQNTFVALGRSKQAIFFSLFRKVIVVAPLTLILPKLWDLGVDGVFWAEPVSNILSGLACSATLWATVMPELRTGEANAGTQKTSGSHKRRASS
jgi:Na+-driven multidrug efflux pump